jgi:LysM repeat protein
LGKCRFTNLCAHRWITKRGSHFVADDRIDGVQFANWSPEFPGDRRFRTLLGTSGRVDRGDAQPTKIRRENDRRASTLAERPQYRVVGRFGRHKGRIVKSVHNGSFSKLSAVTVLRAIVCIDIMSPGGRTRFALSYRGPYDEPQAPSGSDCLFSSAARSFTRPNPTDLEFDVGPQNIPTFTRTVSLRRMIFRTTVAGLFIVAVVMGTLTITGLQKRLDNIDVTIDAVSQQLAVLISRPIVAPIQPPEQSTVPRPPLATANPTSLLSVGLRPPSTQFPGQPIQAIESEAMPVQEVTAAEPPPAPALSLPPHPAAEHPPHYITIERGQSLIRIARANHVSAAAIAVANHLEPPYPIQAGSRLLIPDQDPPANQ